MDADENPNTPIGSLLKSKSFGLLGSGNGFAFVNC